jgi:hypothetical protein
MNPAIASRVLAAQAPRLEARQQQATPSLSGIAEYVGTIGLGLHQFRFSDGSLVSVSSTAILTNAAIRPGQKCIVERDGGIALVKAMVRNG